MFILGVKPASGDLPLRQKLIARKSNSTSLNRTSNTMVSRSSKFPTNIYLRQDYLPKTFRVKRLHRTLRSPMKAPPKDIMRLLVRLSSRNRERRKKGVDPPPTPQREGPRFSLGRLQKLFFWTARNQNASVKYNKFISTRTMLYCQEM